MCATCDPHIPKRIELIVRPLLVDVIGVAATISDDALLGGAGCDAALRRPDLLFVCADETPANISKPLALVSGRIVCVEIDEHGGHPDRTPECEAGKMWDQTVALKKLCGEATHVFFARFNPDECDVSARTSLDKRIAAVGAHVRWLLADGWRTFVDVGSAAPHVSYHYYHSKCTFHIEHVRARPDSFHLYDVSTAAMNADDTSDIDDNIDVPIAKRRRVDDGGGGGGN